MVDANIRLRAADVRRPGQYTGLFEWMVFTELEKCQVLLLFGSNAVDVRAHVGGDLPAVDSSRTLRAVAAQMRSFGPPLAAAGVAGSLQVNHWMIGKTLPTVSCSSAALSEASAGADVSSAARHAGWAVEPTNASGDCGVDVMSEFLGLPRNYVSWRSLRAQLSDKMITLASDPGWQSVFSVCGESAARLEPPVRPPEASAGSASSPAAPSSPIPLQPPPLPPPAANPLAESPVGNPVAESSAGKPLAESAAGKPPAESSTVTSFTQFVNALPADQLAEITHDYWSFRVAQDKWEVAQPKSKRPILLRRGQRSTTTVLYRLAVGERYNRWLGGDGAGSSSPLKVTGALRFCTWLTLEFLRSFWRVYLGCRRPGCMVSTRLRCSLICVVTFCRSRGRIRASSFVSIPSCVWTSTRGFGRTCAYVECLGVSGVRRRIPGTGYAHIVDFATGSP